MGADLGAQPEPELPGRSLLKLPRGRRGDEGAARERNSHAGGQLEFRCGLGGHRGVQIGGATCLGEQHPGEPGRLCAGGQGADLAERKSSGHHVDVHAADSTRMPSA